MVIRFVYIFLDKKQGLILSLYGDNLSIFNMKAFIEAHHSRPCSCEIAMMTFETEALH